jgi:hypothetical protein
MSDEQQITKKDLERVISDPAVRTYLKGLFAAARSLVTHNTTVRDFVEDELQKPSHDINIVKDVLSEYELKMQNLLGSFLEAEQLLYTMDAPPDLSAIDVSDTLMGLTAKLRQIFGDLIRFTTDIDPGIFSIMRRSSLEIAADSMISRIIENSEPNKRPSLIHIELKTIESNAYLVITPQEQLGSYSVPPPSVIERAVFTTEFNEMFLERYAKIMGGAFFRRGSGLALSFAVSPVKTPVNVARDVVFEFDNKRFSPTTAKMSKYVK